MLAGRKAPSPLVPPPSPRPSAEGEARSSLLPQDHAQVAPRSSARCCPALPSPALDRGSSNAECPEMVTLPSYSSTLYMYEHTCVQHG